MSRIAKALAVTAVLALAAQGQMVQDRRAAFRGSPVPDGGKCTIEVDVDDVAQVEISGDMGRIRTLSGQPSVWRRFECSGPLPPNMADFRFSGVDGRGRQTLVSDPRNNRGVAVIRIEDPKAGREGYTFDIEWRGAAPVSGDVGRRDGDRRDGDRRDGDRWEASKAIASCQDAVRDRAGRDYGIRDLDFRRTVFDDNPGRSDWVVGSFVGRGRGRDRDEYSFSCAVDFDERRLRDVQIQRR
ncbi:MAG TPA: hypothetical protein VN841_00700 [Bryobacteraceae bacterium]|nr:hypothetical protein [Bryobacteraceae bacterium]